MNSKPKKKAAKKEEPTFDKKAFLKAALPIVGIYDKKIITVATALTEQGLVFEDYGPLPQVVMSAVYKSDTSAALRTKLHLAIKQLTKVMELTM